jgi:hypothetical protein
MSNDASEMVLMSHRSVAWPGSFNLYTQQDGILLAVGRRSLVMACERLREEGYGNDCVVLIRDADGIAADQAGKIGNVLTYARPGR